ncbi:MAG: hypothetical protein AAF614_28840 [Chloroflexota bacterium]
MAIFRGKFKTKQVLPNVNWRKTSAFIFFILLVAAVYLIDGSPAGAFLSFIIITIFFSTVLSHWRDQNQ